MPKVTRNILPKPLRPDDLGGQATVVCTVKDVTVDAPSPQTRRGKSTFLRVVEYPEFGIYLNETSKDYAIQGFGSDDSDDWIGKLVPLVVVQSENMDRDPSAPRYVKKIWIAPPENWAVLLKGKKAKTEK